MKGGLTASLTAFCLLSRFEKSLNGRLTLMLVSDEETGGRWGTEWLLKNHPEFRGDACINGEPSALTVRIGEKGKSFLRLVARGLAGHGSLAQHIGKNAILEMLKAMPIVESMTRIRGRFTREEERLLREVKKGFETYSPGMGSALDHVTVNVGTIKGGVKVNIVPACCEAEVDVRLPLGVTPKWLKIELARRLRSAKLDLKTEFMDMPVVEANYTDPSEKIVKLVVENATSATGEKPMFSFTSGRTDCCYFRERGVPSVVYGPRAFNAAAADEHILIDHLLKVAKVHVGAAIDFLHTA
jgi:succinyl-diaminopimelate desuccinylase